MRASKVSRETLIQAADEVGVRIECDAIGRQFRVKLYPAVTPSMYRPACKVHRDNGRECHCRRWSDERGDAKYQRQSASGRNENRVHAVCWHGFRDFFRAVYRREPMARFTTVMATWQDSDHFEANFQETGHKNIGSQMYPVAAASACRCSESGSTGPRYGFNSDEHPHMGASWLGAPLDTYGADEADGAMCRAMANALRGN